MAQGAQFISVRYAIPQFVDYMHMLDVPFVGGVGAQPSNVHVLTIRLDWKKPPNVLVAEERGWQGPAMQHGTFWLARQ